MPTQPPTNIRAEKANHRLIVDWPDGLRHAYPFAVLRAHCPSASEKIAREEANPLAVLKKVPSSDLLDIRMVGNYALNFTWGDGHNAGIYTWDYLRELAALPQVETSAIA